MPTKFQLALCIPVLYEVAIRAEPISTQRGDSDLENLQGWVSKWFPDASARAKSNVLKCGQSEFYNSHQWVVKQLKEDKYVQGENWRYFKITEPGLVHLNSQILSVLKSQNNRETNNELMNEASFTDKNNFVELLTFAWDSITPEIIDLANSKYELFLKAFELLPSVHLGNFLSYTQGLMRPIIAEWINDQYEI